MAGEPRMWAIETLIAGEHDLRSDEVESYQQ
jgi:hypothetical protein